MSIRNIAALLLIASALAACQQHPGSLRSAACFRSQAYTDLNNRPSNISANPKCQGDVFYFLSPDCPLCQGYAPLLKKLAETYNNREFAFYAVFPGTLYTKQEIASFLSIYQLQNLGVVCDTSESLTHCLGAAITPEVVVTDTAGKLIYKGRIDDQAWDTGQKKGLTSTHELEVLLANLSAGKRPVFTQTEAVGCSIENK
jgi:thiol-disulfide isomerase/thioredoxin